MGSCNHDPADQIEAVFAAIEGEARLVTLDVGW